MVLEKTIESLKEINSGYSLERRAKAEALIIWPPGVKSRLTGKDPDAGKIEGRRRSQQQRMRWLDSITDSMDMNLSKFRDIVNNR